MAAHTHRVGDQPWGRRSLIGLAMALTLILLFIPVVVIFTQRLRASGSSLAVDNLAELSLHPVGLARFAPLPSLPLNLVFGTALAWSVTRFRFPGRKLLITLIDIPSAVSPVVAGLLYLLLYGRNGWLGGWLSTHDVQLMFAWPGIVMVTVFVTCPF